VKPTALFSLHDTSRVEWFAEQLIRSGWAIIASKETVKILESKGLCVQDIADFTGIKEDYGFPPTLHPKVEYALTTNNLPRIDLVYVIPYPLSSGNDVGGRTLLALAVKGNRIPVTSVEDMERVTAAISQTGQTPDDLRSELANKACFEIAAHYSSLITNKDKHDILMGRFSFELLNGENPYQVPASVYASETDDPLSLTNFKQLAGEAPCFTNMADADSILHTICLASEAFRLNTGSAPYLCVAAKHGNACGMGADAHSPAQAVTKALFGNPQSIWGGEVVTNFPIDESLGKLLFKSEKRERLLGDSAWMLDLVMAPHFTPEAVSVLGKRARRKLLENSALLSPMSRQSGSSYRTVRGGFLRQPPATYVLDLRTCRCAGKDDWKSHIPSLVLAWAVVFGSNHGGNEIALVKDGALLAAGGGPSSVESATTAVNRANRLGHDITGATFAADAFFPFTDGPAILCDAGVTSGCVPAGGNPEAGVEDYFRDRGVAVAYLPPDIRGFCRH
jgi:phosphoribosylaminoimidazolecarboxamide formyltransferase / IMP cyclohydrolase